MTLDLGDLCDMAMVSVSAVSGVQWPDSLKAPI